MTVRAQLVRSPVVIIGAILVTLFAALAVFAPWVAPYEPQDAVADSLLAPSAAHWLGTNALGQDVLSQIIWGARPSLTIAMASAAIVLVLAAVVGTGAALRGGVVDLLAMRVVDVLLAVPTLPAAILVAALVGPSRISLILVVGGLMWPPIARVVRSQALTIRQRGFVAAAQGFGARSGYVLRRHLLPAVGPVLIAGLVAVAGTAILLEASLAFLGLGDPTAVSWGQMLNRALTEPGVYFTQAWTWLVLPAGFAIAGAVVGFTFLGVGLEPVLNPRVGRSR